MRVISKARLKGFWQSPGRAESEGPLRAWYTHVNSRTVAWRAWGDVKSDFSAASLVGNCAVFNIGGRRYRFITRVLYPSQKVFVLRIMTHSEYDDDKWKDECGCFNPPPKPTNAPPRRR
jgi:mRNA interferase HigB